MTLPSTLAGEILRGAAEYDTVPVVVASTVRPRTVTLGGLVEDARRVAGAFQRI